LTEPRSFSCPSCPAALPSVRLAPRLQPCLEPALRPALLSPILQLSSSACPAALPLAFASGPASDQPRGQPLGPASDSHCLLLPSGAAVGSAFANPRPCLDLVSGSRLLQYFRPEPATSHRLSILWLPSFLGLDLRPSASTLRLLPFPWPFGFALSSVSRPLPRASLLSLASA